MKRGPEIREHEGEPIPGLPERLPGGETVLWQGAPDWRALARHAFHIRGLALYFVALAAWRAATLLGDGAGGAAATLGAAEMLAIGAIPVALVAGYAKLTARTALYTLTNRRAVLRVGIALPTTVNLPFAAVSTADMRLRRDGTGDLVLTLLGRHRVSWVALWPHARPWRVARPEPTLRCIPDAEKVGDLLAEALAGDAMRQPMSAPAPAASPVPAGIPAAA